MTGLFYKRKIGKNLVAKSYLDIVIYLVLSERHELEYLAIFTMLLSTLLAEPRSCCPFLLLQSTAAQSIFPLLRALCIRPTVHTICFSLLYAPSTLANSNSAAVDWTAQIPGYSDSYDFQAELFAKVNSGS